MPKVSLLHHPLRYYQRKWLKYRCKLATAPTGRQVREIRGVKVLFDLDLGRMVKGMYYDAYEFEIVQLLKRYLKPGGVFLDIGANVGYFSGLALGLVGRTGAVHSFEPVERYYRYIAEMAAMNPAYTLVANNIAVGGENTQATFYTHEANIGAGTIVADYFPAEERSGSITVPVRRLDTYLAEKHVAEVSLIKIDTQGYELAVIEGAVEFLRRHKEFLPPIIMEITPFAFELQQRSVAELQTLMTDLGYEPWCICDTHRLRLAKITRPNVDVLFRPLRSRR